jgi:hypothetical protein
MASERFETGFCFARHLSTAAIISSLKPMIFLTGCVSGRPTISHKHIQNNWRGGDRPIRGLGFQLTDPVRRIRPLVDVD